MKARTILFSFLLAFSMSSIAFARTTRVEGRVLRATSGDILLERSIDVGRAADYERLGFRRVQSLQQVADKTMIGGHIYVLYLVETEYSRAFRAADIQGRDVILEIEHDAAGFPLVVHARVK